MIYRVKEGAHLVRENGVTLEGGAVFIPTAIELQAHRSILEAQPLAEQMDHQARPSSTMDRPKRSTKKAKSEE